MLQNIQHNHLKHRRLQFLRAHQDAFDVEPNFLLALYEEAALGIEGTCGVESMCNVQQDKLFALDFHVCSDQERTWPGSFTHAVKFLDQVESKVGVQLNRDLLKRFVAAHIGSHKLLTNTIGIDLRSRYQDSCVKVDLYVSLEEDPGELVRTALELDGGSYDPEVLQVLLKSTFIFRFNIFLNGYSDVELLPLCPGDQHEIPQSNRDKYLRDYIQKNFSAKVNYLLAEATFLTVTYSKARQLEPRLIFHYEDIKDIRKNFSFNSLGDRACSFAQNQDCITYGGVSVTEQELEQDRLENFGFLYNQRDECTPNLLISRK